MTFLFPFAYSEKKKSALMTALKNNGYTFFTLHNESIDRGYYGNRIEISHEELDQFFYPFIEDKLFPENEQNDGLLRYSKKLHQRGTFSIHFNSLDIQLLSIDITLCPFEIGIITLRAQMGNAREDIGNVLDFIHHFRVLEAKLQEEKGGILTIEEQIYNSTESFIFDDLLSFLKPFLLVSERKAGYYGGLPYFEDERMFSSAFLVADNASTILDEHLYRIGQIDGKTTAGHDYISSYNTQYIAQFVENHTHTRWAPSYHTVTTSHAQMFVANEFFIDRHKALKHFMSTNYYNILIHYFYKITLLKLSYMHSEIRWGKDQIIVEKLIEMITQFSSRYYFGELVVQSDGRELAQFLGREFHINEMFIELRDTLNELYRVQADQAKDQQNQLLFMLTVFTVISGIYGMNLVIEDLQGAIDWSKLTAYSIFEWITLITAISGISISIALTINAGIRSIRNYMRKKKI